MRRIRELQARGLNIGLALLAASFTAFGQQCTDLQEYRAAAHQQATSKVLGIVEANADGSVGLRTQTALVATDDRDRFAAFFLPATMYMDAAKLVSLDAAASNATPELSNAWGILLVPIKQEDCRELLVAPASFEHVLEAKDPRRRLANSLLATQLLNSAYRIEVPNGPVVLDIVDASLVDIKSRLQFADYLRKPLVLTVESGVLPIFAAKPVTPLPPDVPPFAEWNLAMFQFAWPASLRAMSQRANLYWKDILPIMTREPRQWTTKSIAEDMRTLEKVTRELKPIGELATADLHSLSEIPADLDTQTKALYGIELALIERTIGNDYTLLMSQADDLYTRLDAATSGMPVSQASAPFDVESLKAYRPHAVPKGLNFETLVISQLDGLFPASAGTSDDPLSAAVNSLATNGAVYVLFRDALDPTSSQQRVKPEIVLVLPIEPLVAAQLGELNRRMPADSCSERFSHGDVRWGVSDGQLTANVDVQMQQWLCVRHKWVCFHGWTPHWCENEIKTRLFKSHANANARVEALAIGQGLSLMTTYNLPLKATTTTSVQHKFPQPSSHLVTIPPIAMQRAFFTLRASDGQMVFVVSGAMPAMEAGVGAAMREAMKSYLDQGSAK